MFLSDDIGVIVSYDVSLFFLAIPDRKNGLDKATDHFNKTTKTNTRSVTANRATRYITR